jgi:hypothetical protein
VNEAPIVARFFRPNGSADSLRLARGLVALDHRANGTPSSTEAENA